MKKEQYQYNPELKGPDAGVDISNDGLLMRLYIRYNSRRNRRGCEAWKPSDDVEAKQVEIPVRDGGTIAGCLMGPKGASEVLPVMYYCHGGAFYIPIMPPMLDLASWYIRALHCRVLIPQYRLAPGHPYPTPQMDCIDGLQYLAGQGSEWRTDPERIVVYGDSAGGCLAAGTTYACGREIAVKPTGQLLIYPVTDYRRKYPSLTEYQDACWSRKANETMWKLYLGRRPQAGEHRTPMGQKDPSSLPLTYVEVAGTDVLRDQGLAYANKLRRAGVEVILEKVPGAYHGYDIEMDSPLVQRMLERRAAVMRQMME